MIISLNDYVNTEFPAFKIVLTFHNILSFFKILISLKNHLFISSDNEK